MTYSDPNVTYSEPKVTFTDPKVTYSDPKVTYSDPTVLHTSPYLHLPHQAHITPLVTSNETSGGWWVVEGGNQL